MIRLFCIMIFLAGMHQLPGQDMVRSLVGAPAGDNTPAVQWTLGEPFSGPLGDLQQPFITQGFVQHDISISTDVTEISRDMGMVVWPNPAKDILRIKWAEPGEVMLLLTDVSGKQIFQKEVWGDYCELDIGPYPAAIYFLTITSQNRRVQTVRILKIQ